MGGKRKLFNSNGIALFVLVLAATVLSLAACSSSAEPEPDIFFTVYFETSGGSPVPEKLTVIAGSTIEPPEDAIQLKGFSLNGWCRDEDCAEAWDFENDTVTDNIVLYAFWKPSKTGGGGGGGGRGGGVVAEEPEDDGTGTAGSTPGSGTTTTTPGGTPSGTPGDTPGSGSTPLVNPTVNWPAGFSAYDDQFLLDIALPLDNGIDTPGSFKWTEAGSTSVGDPGKRTHSVTFTPAETSVYNTLIFSVTIKVFPRNPGSGVPGDPYKVYDQDTLKLVGKEDLSWNREKQYVQLDDIDMAGETFTAITPNNNFSNAFTGSYDGNGHKISNLEINYTGTLDNTALFGYVASGGEVKNLILENANIKGDGHVAGIAGRVDNATIENCYVSGTIKGNSSYVGGIAGELSGDLGIIRDCIVEANLVEGSSRVGGIVGNVTSEAKVNNCYVIGNIKGASNVGGIVGTNYAGSSTTICEVNYCYAAGTVSASTDYAGGIVGRTQYSKTQNCVALNNKIITAGSNAARIAGNKGTGATLLNNYARSDMKINGSPLPTGTGLSSDTNGEEITTHWTSLTWWTGKGFTAPFWSGKLPPTVP